MDFFIYQENAINLYVVLFTYCFIVCLSDCVLFICFLHVMEPVIGDFISVWSFQALCLIDAQFIDHTLELLSMVNLQDPFKVDSCFFSPYLGLSRCFIFRNLFYTLFAYPCRSF